MSLICRLQVQLEVNTHSLPGFPTCYASVAQWQGCTSLPPWRYTESVSSAAHATAELADLTLTLGML